MIMWLITNCTCQHIHINLQQFLNIRIFASWVGACLQLPDLKLVHKSSRDYWIDLYCCFVDKTTQIILFCCNLSWSIEKCGTSSIEKSCNMQKDGCPSACKLSLMQWHLKNASAAMYEKAQLTVPQYVTFLPCMSHCAMQERQFFSHG